MEQRIRLIEWNQNCYHVLKKHFDESSTETLGVGFGKAQQDPLWPSWERLHIQKVLLPVESDFVTRTAAFIQMKREFSDKIRQFGEEQSLQPLVFDHKQPIDFPSSTDVATSRKVAEFYPGAVMGSYSGRAHRFFRITATGGMEPVPWTIDDGTYDRQELAYGKEAQCQLAAAKILLVGAGGIGSKVAIDLALKGCCWIDIVDPDVVEPSNLARLPFPPSSVGKDKTAELVRLLNQLRPNGNFHVSTSTIEDYPEKKTAEHNLIIVATDNLPSRLYCNDLSLLHRVPSIQVGASIENGNEAVSRRIVIPGVTPCYECHKKFTPEQLRYGYLSPKLEERLKRSNYGLPRPVASVVDLNSIAAGLVGDAVFKIVARISNPATYVFFSVSKSRFHVYDEKRDRKCRACSKIPDFERLEPSLATDPNARRIPGKEEASGARGQNGSF